MHGWPPSSRSKGLQHEGFQAPTAQARIWSVTDEPPDANALVRHSQPDTTMGKAGNSKD